MKLITAIIRPSRLTEVKDALKAEGVVGMTLTEVNGFGRQFGHTEHYRGAEYTIEFVPKMKVEILTGDTTAESIADAIADAARTDEIGDGKIWITEVTGVVRIRTNERGAEAI
jgi:nitrogen regulatory protein P-II 1